MTETCAFGSTFDEAGHVGEHEALLGTDTNHAEMRMERRERIVGDLGTGVGDGRNEGRLACVGHAEKTDVGEHLKLKLERTVLTGFARSRLLGRTIDRALEVKVAETALAARSEQLASAVNVQVGNHLAGIRVAHKSTHGHAQNDVVAACAIAVRAAAVLAVGSEELARVAIVHEGIDVAVGNRVDGAASAAITAVGTTLRNELFAAEACRTVAALAALDFNFCFINKLHEYTF